MSRNPKRPQSARTAELGMNAVATFVNDSLGWILRRVHGEADYGIDAFIDVVGDDSTVTGQSLAVQVKCGKSFFREENEVGYIFRGERKHLNYYANHAIPVLIIICDPESRACFWQEFDIDRTDGSASGWSLTIPKVQVLDNRTKLQWLSLLGPQAELDPELNRQWAMNELLKAVELIQYPISRQSIEDLNFEHICSFFDRLEKNIPLCLKTQGRVEISISGYDDDPRELWEIEEVRNWFRLAYPMVRYWFYFLNTKGKATSLRLLFLLMCDPTRHNAGRKLLVLDQHRMKFVFDSCFVWMNELTEELGLSDEVNKRITAEVFEACKAHFIACSS